MKANSNHRIFLELPELPWFVCHSYVWALPSDDRGIGPVKPDAEQQASSAREVVATRNGGGSRQWWWLQPRNVTSARDGGAQPEKQQQAIHHQPTETNLKPSTRNQDRRTTKRHAPGAGSFSSPAKHHEPKRDEPRNVNQ